MARLHIFARTRNGRTESLYAVQSGSEVVFHNLDCDEPLEILIARLRVGFRSSLGRPRRIVVPPGGKKRFRVPLGTKPETTWKYSARIGRTRPEDPIIYVPGKRTR